MPYLVEKEMKKNKKTNNNNKLEGVELCQIVDIALLKSMRCILAL